MSENISQEGEYDPLRDDVDHIERTAQIAEKKAKDSSEEAREEERRQEEKNRHLRP